MEKHTGERGNEERKEKTERSELDPVAPARDAETCVVEPASKVGIVLVDLGSVWVILSLGINIGASGSATTTGPWRYIVVRNDRVRSLRLEDYFTRVNLSYEMLN